MIEYVTSSIVYSHFRLEQNPGLVRSVHAQRFRLASGALHLYILGNINMLQASHLSSGNQKIAWSYKSPRHDCVPQYSSKAHIRLHRWQ